LEFSIALNRVSSSQTSETTQHDEDLRRVQFALNSTAFALVLLFYELQRTKPKTVSEEEELWMKLLANCEVFLGAFCVAVVNNCLRNKIRKSSCAKLQIPVLPPPEPTVSLSLTRPNVVQADAAALNKKLETTRVLITPRRKEGSDSLEELCLLKRRGEEQQNTHRDRAPEAVNAHNSDS